MPPNTADSLDLTRSIAVVLAGGEGTRLHELTRAECKPALHFAGGQRIVDFTMANLHASGFAGLMVATQFMPGNLSRHLMQVWAPSFPAGIALRHGPDVVAGGYAGTAAALAANAMMIEAAGAEEVVILSADHLCAMDYRPLIAAHRASGAGITLAAMPVPLAEAGGHCIITEAPGRRISAIADQPAEAAAMPDRPDMALASLGVYVARWEFLRGLLSAQAPVDIVRDLLPLAVAQGAAGVWVWGRADDPLPYWREVCTLDSFREAWLQHDTRDRPVPRPVAPDAAPPVPPAPNAGLARFAARLGGGGVQLLAPRLRPAEAARWTVLDGTVMMPGSRVSPGVRLTRSIVAPGTAIPDGLVVGEDPAEDARWFRRSPDGTTLITTQMLAHRASNRPRLFPLSSPFRALLRQSV